MLFITHYVVTKILHDNRFIHAKMVWLRPPPQIRVSSTKEEAVVAVQSSGTYLVVSVEGLSQVVRHPIVERLGQQPFDGGSLLGLQSNKQVEDEQKHTLIINTLFDFG